VDYPIRFPLPWRERDRERGSVMFGLQYGYIRKEGRSWEVSLRNAERRCENINTKSN
jgi:hypothetical protein